ncbi:polysaccharide deacetylase family protein [Dactylosporangium sp. AC04546]|uniref:polysaccharide deacetylase family protein n=1 Tax=Dactylosporangium sp. AC04546 TaxID=2862460 RepID=UPI001EDDD385|nr:polysaccharide deacetylase family protein [Dactylosporangium sp. AC04546]WVK88828.1 polysaccharide deacetylase family protein [Dactylosporangium sp. AC04546]
MSRRLLAAGVSAAVVALHAGPAVTALPLVRRHLPALSGVGRPGTVALTLDDGPDPGSTPAFLTSLARLRVPATFFVLGAMAAKAPGLLRRIHDDGHEIAVHGWTHRDHLRMTPGRVHDELARTADLIAGTCGAAPVWFRPPYGILAAGSLLAAARLGLRPVLWSAWGRDWEAGATTGTVLSHLRSGGIRGGATLLLHDSDCAAAPGAWRSALGALTAIAGECERQGLRLARMSHHVP